ncbi:hypothetical protein [Paenibacillus sp. SI8]|uniref:DUF7507 domain-containing protein n=1 Tax=unclassified Paenibacillus TaxID=185978 RepID=UPI003465C9C6
MNSIPLIVRATFNATGAITFTGNTLGLSRSDTAGAPGTMDSIGAFTTTNTSSVYGTFPSGTTSNYLSNSSSAILVLPAGSSVLYAELIWGGSYKNGNVNLVSVINNPVTFTTPAGTFSISPDSATSNQVDLGNDALAYVRSANVTTLIQQGGAGTYTTGGVAGTIVINGDSTANHAGWTLGVIYQNPSLPFRNMSLRAGAVLVQATSDPVNTTLTGFATPVSGALGGRALFSAQEGDANRTGDQALFGPNSSSLSALSGLNNFANNFFASQINNDAGQLNTTGTFGTRNQTNGAPGSNISGGRQGWDITNVDVSARLVNNQSSAVLSLTTSGDAYVVNGNAIQVDINAPKIGVVKSANVSGAIVGDTVTYTVTVSNTGTANAASIVLSDALPSGSSFVKGSVTVAGVAKSTYDITAGAPLGSLNLNSSITATYKALISSLPSPQQIDNTANAAFTFQSVAGGSIISGVIPSNTVSTIIYSPKLTITKSASTPNASVGSQVQYTLQIVNSGNIGAVTTITDNIPAGSSFVTGSFRVNGTVISGANPAAGVNIGTVAAGATTTVTFQVQVNSLPSPPQFVNQATAVYTFQPPDGRTVSGTAASNTVTIPVTLPNVTVNKIVNSSEAVVGDLLTYTSVIANNGVEGVSNVIFTDPIPIGSTFVSGSVVVAGSSRPTASPTSGISVGTIPSGGSLTVTFQVTVTSLPSPAQLTNQSSVSFSSGTFSGLTLSNQTTTAVYQPQILIRKMANMTNSTVGDTILYSIVVQNTGNLTAQVTVTDPIPAGSEFVPNSVTINGVTLPGSSPLIGISLGGVTPGSSVTVTFQIVIHSLPSPAFLVNQASGSYTYQLPSDRTLSGSSSSNTVTITVSAPNVTLTKTVNHTAAAVNEVLTYTLVATNNGFEAVNQVVVSDTIPAGSVFVTGSVTVNGVAAPNANPLSGILVGTLNPLASVIIGFQLRVTSLPEPAALSNRASVSFTSGSFQGSSVSDTVVTPIYQAIIGLKKSSSSANATVGDTLTYFIRVENSGNTAATVNVTDTIPAGAAFVSNSIIVGATPTPGLNPVTGIPIGTLHPGDVVTVSFLITVQTLPPNQKLLNQAGSTFSFVLPDGRQAGGTSSSNSVTVSVSEPNVSIALSAAPSLVVTGDTLTYTSVVTNQGISSVNNVVLSDSLQNNTSFITGSVLVAGISRPTASPSAGIPIGTIASGASVTVTFEVKITMPNPTQVTNQSAVSFTSGTFSGSSLSNITTTPVTQPQINLQKSASIQNATVGDSIIYSIIVNNTGNLDATVTLTDTIPAGTIFSQNSVNVNSVPQPGISPTLGISLGTVSPGSQILVTFEVVVNTLPSPQQLTNQAFADYTFTPPDGRTLDGSASSNTVTIPVSSPNVTLTKSSIAIAAALGDTIAYAVNVTNNGIEAINHVLFSDPIPQGATFVTGSVKINGVSSPALNPATGFALGTIAPSASVLVEFSIQVAAIPPSGQISNQANANFTSGAFSGLAFSNTFSTPVDQPVISITKSANTNNATVGDSVAYTLIISNTGTFAASVTVTDTIPAGSSFVPNSVLVNGFPSATSNPTTGIAIGSLAPGASATVLFTVIIDSLPTPQQISNQGFAAYSFTLPDGRTLTGAVASNIVSFPVSAPNVSAAKSTPTTASYVGDTITYTTAITNSGIESVNNVVFSDPISTNSILVPGSVTVDGLVRPNVNPSQGITIGSIGPGATVLVAFSIQVSALPSSGTLSNQSFVSFTSGTFSGASFSNTIVTPVYQPILSAQKSANTANATVGDTVVYTVTFTNTGNYGAAVVLTDVISSATSFVPNSVIIDGAPAPGADPSAGIPVGDVTSTTTVMFSVLLNSLPPGQQLTNQGSSAYAFTLPDGRMFNGSIATNILTIPTSSPEVSAAKSTTVTDAVVGDVIPYRIDITNNGIENVNNVVLTDIVPSETSFVTGSVVVGGAARPAANPATGVQIGTIAPGATVAVIFNVTVNTLPVSGQVSNRSSVSFTSGAFSGSTFSNTLVIPVYQPIVILVKSADTNNATVGDNIVYMLDVQNNGNLDANVTIIDTIPSGAAFVPNSVIIDGVPQPGANPSTGIAVGNVPANGSVAVMITLEVTLNSLPSPQQLRNQATANYTYSPPDGRQLTGSVNSNIVTIPVSAPNVMVVKSALAVDAVVGDLIPYNIVVTNRGIETVHNVIFIDAIPDGTNFVTGSVTVNGAARPTANPNSGISIGSIAAGASVTVIFNVMVVPL